MNYINLETNTLVTLVGRKNGKIDWANMGTNADLINLTNIKTSKTNPETNKIIYVLPIENLEQANNFRQKCKEKFDVDVSILSEEEAKEIVDRSL
jgi:hypothetical protein